MDAIMHAALTGKDINVNRMLNDAPNLFFRNGKEQIFKYFMDDLPCK